MEQTEQMEVSEVNRADGHVGVEEVDKVDGSHQNYPVSVYGVCKT
jgi:hypothetical protein